MIIKENDLKILLSGSAGQGLNTIEEILTIILKEEGYFIFGTKEYMSRIRGGNNSIFIRVSDKIRNSILNDVDFLFLINKNSFLRHIDRLKNDSIVFYRDDFLTSEDKDIITRSYILKRRELDEDFFDKNFIMIDYNFELSEYFFSIFYPIFIVGFISKILGVNFNSLQELMKNKFLKKGEKILNNNLFYVEEGYKYGSKFENLISVKIEKNNTNNIDLISGAYAVSMGAIKGGCNFISSYPMSPATTVFTNISKIFTEYNKKNKIDDKNIKERYIVEQAEDEISAINMAIGASYAGAKSIVSTSGGGFALMTEGISLAAMTETPIVVHIGQRPGPATGFPTRTEEADFNLVRFAGHGEFPKVIYSPGTPEEACSLTAKAFYISQKYQIPAFILTSQYFLDSIFSSKKIEDIYKNFDFNPEENFIVKTSKDYFRYELKEDGVSPRGIPGFGEGVVRVDSDEHDIYGHITESGAIRKIMVEKRNKKINKINEEFVFPNFYGDENYNVLIVCWGALYNIVKEVYNIIKNSDEKNKFKKYFDNIHIGILHFSQIYPIPERRELISYFEKAKEIIIVEQNYSCQFGGYLKEIFNIDFSLKILKYDGYIITPEEIIDSLYKFIKNKIII